MPSPGAQCARAASFRPPAADLASCRSGYQSRHDDQRITIAHLSDVHLGPIRGFTPRYWNLKRRRVMPIGCARRALLSAQRARSPGGRPQAQAPDHIVVTGDLANIGLPQEHIDALAWLELLGPPERVSVIPGNHDIYRAARHSGTARWAAYMASNAEGAGTPAARRAFPFVRLLARRRPDRPQLGGAHATVDRLGPGRQGAIARLRTSSTPRRAGLFGSAHSPSAAAGPGLAHAGAQGCGGAAKRAARARRRARRPWPQPSQHAGCCSLRGSGNPDRGRTVCLARPSPQARAAGPLQSLPHRRTALAVELSAAVCDSRRRYRRNRAHAS